MDWTLPAITPGPYSGNVNSGIHGEGMRLTQKSVQNIVTKYAKICGLLITATPETLRHCFATYMAGEGVNPVPVRFLFSHESSSDISKYMHASDKYAEETHRKYHPLAKPY